MSALRANRVLHFGLSAICVAFGVITPVYYLAFRGRSFSEVSPLLEAGLVSAALFWALGMVFARRLRRAQAAIHACNDVVDRSATELVIYG